MLTRSLYLFGLALCAVFFLSLDIAQGKSVEDLLLSDASASSSSPATVILPRQFAEEYNGSFIYSAVRDSESFATRNADGNPSAITATNSYVSDPFTQPLPTIAWTELLSGLELGITRLPASEHMGVADYFVILRVDPKSFDFNLYMASEVGASHFMRDWMQLKGLSVGINASMYLPDDKTSTGLMRNKTHVNNPRAGSQMGAFFVTAPHNSKLPMVDILDREETNNLNLLQQYNTVVQNYRFWNRAGSIQWSKQSQMTSIAAVGKDVSGRIVFILSQEALSPAIFADYVRAFPLNITYLMYVEGGSPANLALGLPKGSAAYNLLGARLYDLNTGYVYVWSGKGGLLKAMGGGDMLLPNVIGASLRRK